MGSSRIVLVCVLLVSLAPAIANDESHSLHCSRTRETFNTESNAQDVNVSSFLGPIDRLSEIDANPVDDTNPEVVPAPLLSTSPPISPPVTRTRPVLAAASLQNPNPPKYPLVFNNGDRVRGPIGRLAGAEVTAQGKKKAYPRIVGTNKKWICGLRIVGENESNKCTSELGCGESIASSRTSPMIVESLEALPLNMRNGCAKTKPTGGCHRSSCDAQKRCDACKLRAADLNTATMCMKPCRGNKAKRSDSPETRSSCSQCSSSSSESSSQSMGPDLEKELCEMVRARHRLRAQIIAASAALRGLGQVDP